MDSLLSFIIKNRNILYIFLFLSLGVFLIISIFFSNKKFKLKKIVIPLLICSIFIPPIPVFSIFPEVFPELLLILLGWGLFFFGSIATGKRVISIYPNFLNKYFIMCGLSIILSMIYSMFILRYPLILRDFWEILKLLGYFLVLTLVSNLKISEEEIKMYYKISLIIFFFSALFGISQYYNFANINETITPFYTRRYLNAMIFSSEKRIVGTLTNPNDFSAVMVLASSLSFSGAIFFQDKIIRFFCWFCLAIFSFAIVLTHSRSGFICLFIALFYIFLYSNFWSKRKKNHNFVRRLLNNIFIISIILVIICVVMHYSPQSFFLRASKLENFSQDSSYYIRIAGWQKELETWKSSPIFGYGPGKYSMKMGIDNGWLLLLRRYGILGISAFVLLFVNMYLKLLRIKKSPLSIAMQATILSWAIYMIPAAVYHQIKLMLMLCIFLGLAYSQLHVKDIKI